MKRVFLSVGWCIFAISLITILQSESTKATDWGEGSMVVVSEAKVTQSNIDIIYPCMGLEQPVTVKGYGEKDAACVYGYSNQFRLARFLHGSAYKYAVSHPYQSDYYEIRGICIRPSCVYSPGSDVFIEHKPIANGKQGAVIHKNFSKKMLLQNDALSSRQYYLLNTDDNFGTVVGFEDVPLPVEAINLSNNGRWAVLELPYYGIIRIDTTSMDMRRIVAPGAEYGLMNDPHYELVITDDGKYLATTGYRAPTGMYEVSDNCGDRLGVSTGRYFISETLPCRYLSADFRLLFPGMSIGFNLRFNTDGHRLGISIIYADGKRSRAILAPSATYAKTSFLSLGDSFTSGEGELEDTFYQAGTNDVNFKCHTSSRSYPYIVASRWGIRGNNIACSGARTVDVYGKSDYMGQSAALSSLSAVQRNELIKHSIDTFRPGVVRQSQFVSQYQPKLVSIGIGGNDAGLVGKLSSCLSLGDCEWVSSKEKIAATAKEISEVYYKIRELIRHLRDISPSSVFFTVGYPYIIDDNIHAPCDLVTKTLLSYKERVFIKESLRYLNEVLKAASASENVHFVDVSQSFTDHNLCGRSSTSMMNGVRMGNDIPLTILASSFRIFGSESYHPTPKGHAAVADAILTTFNSADEITDCISCGGQGDMPLTSSYWDVTEAAYHGRQFEDTSIAKDVYELGESMSIKTDSALFMKGTEVVAELHSEPRVLARGLTAEDGSFSSESIIQQDIPPGYHTLHLIGLAPDGVKLDVYRTIAVKSKEIPALSVAHRTGSSRMFGSGIVTSSDSEVLNGESVPAKILSVLDPQSIKGVQTSMIKPVIAKTLNGVLGVPTWLLLSFGGLVFAMTIYIVVRIVNNNSRDLSR